MRFCMSHVIQSFIHTHIWDGYWSEVGRLLQHARNTLVIYNISKKTLCRYLGCDQRMASKLQSHTRCHRFTAFFFYGRTLPFTQIR